MRKLYRCLESDYSIGSKDNINLLKWLMSEDNSNYDEISKRILSMEILDNPVIVKIVNNTSIEYALNYLYSLVMSNSNKFSDDFLDSISDNLLALIKPR